MNVKLDIECTPEEARAFFGLPDLSPVHDAYVSRMTRLVEEGITSKDMEQVMQSWMGGFNGLADMQRAMFGAMGDAGKKAGGGK